ncbi:MAG: hypothetical protein JXB88_19010 [Spirochaetales bacterium]|nr:hypothetical protein [Spirochaetales bacterium]
MIKSKIRQYWNQYSTRVIHLDQFALAKMGLVQSRTILKIDNYMIICAPYQISMRKAFLFSVLNRDEIPFFYNYINKLASLKLTFQKTLKGIPVKFFVWVMMKGISPIKGKENMCLIEVDYKSCPESLINIIGEFITVQKAFEDYYEQLKDKQIYINRNTSRALKYNNFIECFIGNRKIEAKLLSLSVACLHIEFPGTDPLLIEGFEFKSKLYFQSYRFYVKGKIEKTEKTMEGFLKVTYAIQYIPELVDIIQDYFSNEQTQTTLF